MAYLAETPDGAWAEFLRHEEIDRPGGPRRCQPGHLGHRAARAADDGPAPHSQDAQRRPLELARLPDRGPRPAGTGPRRLHGAFGGRAPGDALGLPHRRRPATRLAPRRAHVRPLRPPARAHRLVRLRRGAPTAGPAVARPPAALAPRSPLRRARCDGEHRSGRVRQAVRTSQACTWTREPTCYITCIIGSVVAQATPGGHRLRSWWHTSWTARLSSEPSVGPSWAHGGSVASAAMPKCRSAGRSSMPSRSPGRTWAIVADGSLTTSGCAVVLLEHEDLDGARVAAARRGDVEAKHLGLDIDAGGRVGGELPEQDAIGGDAVGLGDR